MVSRYGANRSRSATLGGPSPRTVCRYHDGRRRRREHGGKQYKDVVGLVGTVSIEVVKASRSERVALAALASAAPFLGVGSQTQSGFGAASVLSMVFDD